MTDTYAVAISPDKRYLVVKRGENHYALIDRKEGITKSTKWRDKKLLAQMMMKGNYREFPKPVRYKGLQHIRKSRKSVERIDSQTSNKKRSKQEQLIIDLGLENFKNDVLTHKLVRKSDVIEQLAIDLEKADNSHLPEGAERFAYKTPTNYDIIYIPINRLKQVYQTDKALDPKKVKE